MLRDAIRDALRPCLRPLTDPPLVVGGGYDIYANSATGSDTNDGLTDATPLQNLSAVKAAAVAHGSGVRIALARGSHWREELDLRSIENASVHGVGDPLLPLPKIDCSDIALGGSFTKTGGRTNVYQISVAHALSGSAPFTARWFRAWEDGERLKWVASVELCDAEAGTFHCPDQGALTNPVVVYVHPTGSGSPVSNGKLYEFSARDSALHVGPGYDVRDLHTTRNTHKDGSFRSYYSVGRATRVLASDGLIHNLWIGAGGTAEGCVAYDCEPSTWRSGTAATLFITFVPEGSPLTTSYKDCTAYSAQESSAHDGFYSHTNGGENKLARIEHVGTRTFGCCNIMAGDTTELYVKDAFIEHFPSRADVTTSISCWYGDLSVENATIINGARAFGGSYGHVLVRDVRFYSPAGVSGGLFWTNSAEIEDSTFVFNPPPGFNWNVYQYGAGYGAKVGRNCAYENTLWRTLQVASGETIESDFNVIWTEEVPAPQFSVASVDVGWDDWKAATGGDANSAYATDQVSRLYPNAHLGDFAAADSVVDAGGRHAGSRKHIPRPDWDALVLRWRAGFIE